MLSQHTTMETATSSIETFHQLSNRWTLWAHLPHNTDWSITSYIPIATFTTVGNCNWTVPTGVTSVRALVVGGGSSGGGGVAGVWWPQGGGGGAVGGGGGRILVVV